MFDVAYAEYIRQFKGKQFRIYSDPMLPDLPQPQLPQMVMLGPADIKGWGKDTWKPVVELSDVGSDFVVLTYVDDNLVDIVPIKWLRVRVNKEDVL